MKIKRYVKNPTSVEAFQWLGYRKKEWKLLIEYFIGISDKRKIIITPNNHLEIRTDDWDISVKIGDYLIKDINGDFDTCCAEEFEWEYKLPKEWDEDMKL